MDSFYETFGKYRLAERLALGGMAEVFLATAHGAAGFVKPVVIKRLHPRLNEDEEFIQMLIDEARITAQLIHGNICQVLDLGAVDGAYYIAMEFIAGEDLRTVLETYRQRHGDLPVDAAIHVISEVLAGLDYAHRKVGTDGKPLSIIHRDISPQNILVSYEGEVKIIDFGIAKAALRLVQTQAGVIKGKFRYMAPEQAAGEALDPRADVFAAGVVLYELLRGGPHSVDLSDSEVLRRMRRAEFEPLQQFRKGAPPELEGILRKALERRPRERYASAAAFRADLMRFAAEHRSNFARSELASLMQSTFDENRRRKRSGAALRELPSSASQIIAPVHTEEIPTQGEPAELAPPRRASSSRGTDARQASGPAPSPERSTGTVALDLEDVLLLEPSVSAAAAETAEPDADAADAAPPDPDQTRAYRRQRPIVTREDSVPTAPRPGISPPSGAAVVQRLAGARSGAREHTERIVQADPLVEFREVVPPRGEEPPPPAPAASPSQRDTDVNAARFRTHKTRSSGAPRTVIRGLLGTGMVAVVLAAIWLAVRLASTPAVTDPEVSTASRADGHVRSLDPRPGTRTAFLDVRSKPPGARISLCGRPTGRITPALVRSDAAEPCTLELRLDRYEPYRLRVLPEERGPRLIVATLRRLRQGEPSSRSGQLVVTSIQVGTVYLEGKPVGQTPQLTVPLAPGTYAVEMYFPSLALRTRPRSVTIRAGQAARLHFDPAP